MEITWVFIVFGTWLIALAFLIKELNDPKRKLPPGPRPWPIIGNLNLLGSLPHESLHHLSQKYGDLMLLKFGSKPVLIASSPEMAKEILKTHDAIFASRPALAAGKYTSHNYSDMTWAPYGAHWRQEDHKAERQTEKDYIPKDMVDVLLHLADDPNLEIKLTTDRLMGLMHDLIAGATDTSAATIEWALQELLRRPNTIEKAQEELDRTIGKERWDCNIAGYDIPKGTTAYVNAWSLVRNPKYWDRPEEFIPERFIENNIDMKGQNFSLLPFGFGRRSSLIYANLEINTNNDSDIEEQEQPDLWTAMADANAYINKLYNHYTDLVDLPVPTNITSTVAPHPPEESSSSKRPTHSGFPDHFYDLPCWNSVEDGAYTTTYREELKYYLRLPIQDRRRRINTLDWWRNNEAQYPVLSRLARDILNVPMSTIAESAFSQI
ncbi:hypothetical protein BC332_11292 [Capsicum chinense]|nr:hypothetical protein BC332_11292 [Capsicum chinense]